MKQRVTDGKRRVLQPSGEMDTLLRRQQQHFEAMDEVIRGGVRADVGIMIDSLRRAQHEQQQRDRMMQELQQRHFDTAAVDRQIMMGMANHLS